MSARRVLLIERDVEVAQAVIGFLSSGGDVAEHATHAGPLANGGALPDVVVVRAELPDAEGRNEGCALADGIKAGERTRDLPVVMYSTDASTVASHKSGGSPADAYLSWPFSADALLDQIHLLTDGAALAALAAPITNPEAVDEHLIAEEEVPTDGELEQLFDTPPPPPMGNDEPTVSMPDLPVISPDMIQPLEASPSSEPEVEQRPGPTPLPDSDNFAGTMYDPLAVGLTHVDDEAPGDEPPVGAGPMPGLDAADAELQDLVNGLDAAAFESTREIPAVDDSELDALMEEVALGPPPTQSDPAIPTPAEPAAAPAPPSVPSLDAVVDAEYGAELPPPPPPGPAGDLRDTTLESTPAPPSADTAVAAAASVAPDPAVEQPSAAAHNAQMAAALEVAGDAARAAKEQAEAARTQVQEMAATLGLAKQEAATERAQAASLLESLESERVRAAALEQDVVRLGNEIAVLSATVDAAEQARQNAVQNANAQAEQTASQISELGARSQTDAAVFERVGKAVRIAAALLEERKRSHDPPIREGLPTGS